MTEHYGFTLLKEEYLKEIDSLGRLWRHEVTGAELLSLQNADDNKVFGVNFRTPVNNSTSIPHIMEHSVLCGSRSFPVKDPFVILLKGSLQTFLNAMTYPDKTCYPVASTNLKDFYNLVTVYIDAVFFPLLTEEAFRQEGWRIELDDPQGRPSLQGVVFNEMKGVYSSPDSLLAEASQHSLFPDTGYGLDSGGDPKHIPDLTYDDFKIFHQTFYHPSNARFFFSGDDPEERRLRIIAEAIKDFEKARPAPPIALQKPLSKPIRQSLPYPARADQTEDSQCLFTVNWLLPEPLDRRLLISLAMLEHILIGLPASPLTKALIESGLGEDLAGSGLETELRQMFFSIGLKGLERPDIEKAEKIIFDVLNTLCREGINPRDIEAAVNSIEFHLREKNTGAYPRGLSFMLTALTCWLHGADPFQALTFEDDLAFLKAELAAGKPVFETLIKNWLLENNSRSTVILYPDHQLNDVKAAEEQAILARAIGEDSNTRREELYQDSMRLKKAQQEKDSPQALATIPSLGINDLDREEKELPSETHQLGPAQLLYHSLPTSGLVYLDLGLNLKVLAADELPLTAMFGQSLLQMGTANDTYEELGQRIAGKTGGISPSIMVCPRVGSSEPEAWLFLRGKCTLDNLPHLTGILKDILLAGRPDDQPRFNQIVMQGKSQSEEILIPAGHRQIARRLRSRFNSAGWAEEKMSGIEQLFYLRALAEKVEKNWDETLASLNNLRSKLINSRNIIFNVTADPGSQSKIINELALFADDLPDHGQPQYQKWPSGLAPQEHNEWLKITADVNYVGLGLDLSRHRPQSAGAVQVITRHISTAWLWEQVRMLGGAYGAFCSYDRIGGVLTFASYRDPNIENTLKVFSATAEHLKRLDLSSEDMTRAIIGAMGAWDPYMLPDAKGYVSMLRQLIGDSRELRNTVRAGLLNTTREDFKAFGDLLEKAATESQKAVLSGQEAMDGWHCTKIM